MNKIESISMEGGEGNQKNKQMLYVMMALVGLVIVLSIVQTFQVRALKAEVSTVTGMAVSSAAEATGALDMSSWTEDEKMMYEHHGTIPARFQSASSSKSSSSSVGAMVGGC